MRRKSSALHQTKVDPDGQVASHAAKGALAVGHCPELQLVTAASSSFVALPATSACHLERLATSRASILHDIAEGRKPQRNREGVAGRISLQDREVGLTPSVRIGAESRPQLYKAEPAYNEG
jgi:hypothetical protein